MYTETAFKSYVNVAPILEKPTLTREQIPVNRSCGFTFTSLNPFQGDVFIFVFISYCIIHKLYIIFVLTFLNKTSHWTWFRNVKGTGFYHTLSALYTRRLVSNPRKYGGMVAAELFNFHRLFNCIALSRGSYIPSIHWNMYLEDLLILELYFHESIFWRKLVSKTKQ